MHVIVEAKAPLPERRIVLEWLGKHGIELREGNHIDFARELRSLLTSEPRQFIPENRDGAIAYIKYAAGMISRVGDEVAKRIKDGTSLDQARYGTIEEVRTFFGIPNEVPVELELVAEPEPAPKLVLIEPAIIWAPSQAAIDAFYESWEWKRLRYHFIKDKQRKCACCGRTPEQDGIRIVVDHIKPIRRFWQLRLDPNNLQLLCGDCNQGKGSRDTTDWRRAG